MTRYLLGLIIWSLCQSQLVSADASPPTPPANQGILIAHGIVCALGFALLLPFGAILARYLRTSQPWWYTGHWIAQFGIAGPVIVAGVALGHATSNKYGDSPLDHSSHQNLGNILLGLYIIQCAIGTIIHFFKPKNGIKVKGRLLQNYFHALLGLVVIALGMYQLHTGYDEEWPIYSGTGRLPHGVGVLWLLWFIVIVVVYAAGLVFLRKQYTQEAVKRKDMEPAYTSVTNSTNQYGMDAL
ncbi:hypothetical protein C8R45DRAFT_1006269 [Mycena sanguinolenta]|nr:hypothetical protein C8R45DRAFT_1006269 [Mycena sanguinolenta]